jgi:ammonium transporter, Amt family
MEPRPESMPNAAVVGARLDMAVELEAQRDRVVPIVLALLGSMAISQILASLRDSGTDQHTGMATLLLMMVAAGAVLYLRRHLLAARWMLSLGFLAVLSEGVFLSGGAQGPATGWFMVAIGLVGTLLGARGVVLGFVWSSIVVAGLWRLDQLGMLPEPAPPDPVGHSLMIGAQLLLTAAVSGVALLAIERAVRGNLTLGNQLARSRWLDEETGLPNRSWLRSHLSGLLTQPDASWALVAVEIAGLPAIKASLGPTRTQALLVEIQRRIAGCLKGTDSITRGGESFLLLLEPIEDPQEASAVARRIAASLEANISVAGQDLFVPFHIGIIAGDEGYTDVDRVFAESAAALEHARQNGKGALAPFDASAVSRHAALLAFDARLRHAVTDGEILPFYQPIVSLETGKLSGFEALARWKRPGGELVSPADFVPRAEHTGLVVEIDRTILDQACRQLAEWDVATRGATQHLHVGVNLSARQFDSGGLVRFVAVVLEATGIAPHRLHLELTESCLATDEQNVIDTLRALKDLGVVLLIDDFGTGFSSLSYVQLFPVDLLKIDRSFVSAIGPGTGHALSAGIMALAHAMELGVVAEGIETREQYSILQEMGCEFGQGYYFARPEPAEVAARFFQTVDDTPSPAWPSALNRPSVTR